MLKVTVSRRNDAGTPVEAGSIEFHGIRVHLVNEGVRIPKRNGKPAPFRAVLEPKSFVSADVLEQIRCGLENRCAKGEAGVYEWRKE